MQAAMPIMGKYVTQWKERMQEDVKELEKSSPKAAPAAAAQQ